MKRIFTYGHGHQWRNLTVAGKIANKARGTKMTQVTARNAEEAAIIADQGVDMIITGSDWFADVRRGAPTTFITAALFAGRFITKDEILRGAIEASMQGADSVLTPRSMEVVEMLAKEGLCVQGHVGMVPSTSSRQGGMRTLGKTAAEALTILDDMRRLHEAGAYGCEVECVAEDALAAISKHSPLVTSSAARVKTRRAMPKPGATAPRSASNWTMSAARPSPVSARLSPRAPFRMRPIACRCCPPKWTACSKPWTSVEAGIAGPRRVTCDPCPIFSIHRRRCPRRRDPARWPTVCARSRWTA